MAESQKMVALKKAYADIILNSAKEAASRVMESEKKAIQYQHDLFATKDEALRLLVRLKQMVDAKIIEAEIASSSQQSKIDELEAQLQEAEGVIIDLRAELKWARDKLEKVRNSHIQPSRLKMTRSNDSTYQNATSESYIPSPNLGLQPVTTSDLKYSLFDQRIWDDKCCNTEQTQTEQSNFSRFGIHSSHNAELASVIVGNKKTELFRNGCHVLEGNLLPEKLPPGELDELSFVKSELITKGSNKDDRKFTVPSPKNKNLETLKNFSGEEVRKRVKVRTLRQRTCFGKPKPKRRSCPSQLVKTYETPTLLSCCKRSLVNGNAKPDERSRILLSVKTDNVDMKKHSSELKEKCLCQNSCFMDEKVIVHEGSKQRNERKEQSRDAMSTSFASYPAKHETCQPSSHPRHCKKSSEDQSRLTENEVKLKPLPRLDPGLTLIKGGVGPISGSTNVTLSVKTLNKSDFVKNTENKDIESVNELVKRECETTANSCFPRYESNSEMVNVPLIYSDLEDHKGSEEAMVDVPLVYSDLKDARAPKASPSQVDNNRILKYTFQRKRKKEAMSSPDQSTSLEKNIVKRRSGEKQNDSSEPQKSSIVNGLSNDSSRLAQVARQLISLSGKDGGNEEILFLKTAACII